MKWGAIEVKPLKKKLVYHYKDAWNRRYYTFDEVTWKDTLTKAYKAADPDKFVTYSK